MIKKVEFTYEDFLNNIKNDIHFSFARYGDGEWNAIFMKNGQNCDGHTYFPEMGKRLKDIVISSPKYVMGLQNMAQRLSGPHIEKLLTDNNVDIEWTNSDILHYANMNNKISELFDVLKIKNVILVGPAHLETINKLFNYKKHIKVPTRNCWNNYKQIKESLINTLDNEAEEGDIILICASMMANVLVDDMYNKYGEKYSFLDVGSIFEPHIGMSIRSYHKAMVKNT